MGGQKMEMKRTPGRREPSSREPLSEKEDDKKR